MRKFPAMVYHNTDAGPYITAGIVLAKDPDTEQYNLSYNRLMVKGKDRLGIYMTVGKHLNTLFSKMEERGKPLEVAVSIGNHPAVAIGALAIGPYEEDELGIVGGLLGKPLEMVRCRTVDLRVPAGSEIVLEGEILPGVREEEGPFGEFTGYAITSGKSPVLAVKAVTHRRNPIYQDICGGQHREHLTMATIPMEANYFRVVKGAVPEVEEVRVPAPFTLLISMRKKYEGQARSALLAAFNADIYLKHAIVVDHDIDLNDLHRVLWAVATRMQASRDIFVVPRARGSSLDPSAEPIGVVDKMGIDATAKPSLERFSPLNQVPREALDRIQLEDYIEGFTLPMKNKI
jgi:2,5-furandicarboxylate decarboxylase 1